MNMYFIYLLISLFLFVITLIVLAFFVGNAYVKRKKNRNSLNNNDSPTQQKKGSGFLWIFTGFALGMLLLVIITFVIYIYSSRPTDSYSYDNDEVVWDDPIEIEDASDSEYSFYESTGNDRNQRPRKYAEENESFGSTGSYQDTSNQNDLLRVAFFSDKNIKNIIPAVGDGVKASIVLMGSDRNPSSNEVHEVYFVKPGFRSKYPNVRPPEISGLVYHDLGEDSFLGILLYEEIYDGNKPEKYKISEVKLDDGSAQFLLDFRANDTKWINKTDILYEETRDSRVKSPKVHTISESEWDIDMFDLIF